MKLTFARRAAHLQTSPFFSIELRLRLLRGRILLGPSGVFQWERLAYDEAALEPERFNDFSNDVPPNSLFAMPLIQTNLLDEKKVYANRPACVKILDIGVSVVRRQVKDRFVAFRRFVTDRIRRVEQMDLLFLRESRLHQKTTEISNLLFGVRFTFILVNGSLDPPDYAARLFVLGVHLN
jgi:hypothetical protein